MNRDEIAKNWIELQTLAQDSPEAEKLMWAAEEINLLALRSPEDCWETILEIVDQSEDEWVLTNLAAGPLENLLALNPEKVITLIKDEVKSNTKLKGLLSGVWQNLIPDNVWEQLQLLKA